MRVDTPLDYRLKAVEMGVVMPLLKGRGHSPVGRNRETREENGAPITTAPFHVSGDDFPLNHFNSHSLIVMIDP